MILERVFESAKPKLAHRSIRDVRIGLGLMAVGLDNDLVGVTYVLNNEINHTCTALPQAGTLVGKEAEEIARWAIEGDNVIQKSLGLAVLNSVADFDSLGRLGSGRDEDAVFSVDIKPEDTIGIVGHIGPVIKRLEGRNNKLYVFERDESMSTAETYAESAQPDLLPECQVVFITSSSLINGTLEPLLQYCTKARDVVMVGSSTPLYPEAFQRTGVSVLSGTRWLPQNVSAILSGVSQCAGIKQLMQHGQKISIKVSV